MIKKQNKATDFQKYLKEQLKNREVKKYYDEHSKQLEVAYQLLQLRKRAKISQSELADKIGTNQGNVARMESGRQNFTVSMLSKMARVFNKELIIALR